jgi:hypothetical protein
MKSNKKELKLIGDWNNSVKVGDSIIYREVMPVDGFKESDDVCKPLHTTTRSEAW